jgi:hypothetical protein
VNRIFHRVWIAAFLISLAVLGHCGRKSKDTAGTPPTDLLPFVPSGWTGDDDWSGNAIPIQDIVP